MKKLRWGVEKNTLLKKERGLSFDEIVAGWFLGVERNPSRQDQKLMLFEVGHYVWVVPYVEEPDAYFLKTAFPSRKHTKKYFEGDGYA